MSSKETRNRLIHAIAERKFDGNAKKILIADIAGAVGITRQAFNRYYGDLKPYITGDKLIGELLNGDGSADTGRYLAQNQETISALESELQSRDAKHSKALQRITDNYITTLMNNDITLWQVDKTRATIERQNALLQNYSQQITDLKLKLTDYETEKFQRQTTPDAGSKILLEPNLLPAIDELRVNGDFEKFETNKDEEIQKLGAKASLYSDDSQYKLVIFLDLYLCSFKKFVDNHPRPLNRTYVYIRLPLFTAIEIKLFMKNLSKSASVALFVPHCKSEIEKTAQRKFQFRSIPLPEFQQADKAPTLKPEHGFSEVTYYAIAQGD
ncbi:hypothetical protein [Pseudomonas sp.]|uniref:hypothetical protein n=1 Tax=Pseudomonas sp. TaxID=306 RepID=UPI002489C6D1|nr:hypothetical protein [Pseudomonas sp.]MDI1333148.1 hypothetical protein [Pseudomonas sp.]